MIRTTRFGKDGELLVYPGPLPKRKRPTKQRSKRKLPSVVRGVHESEVHMLVTILRAHEYELTLTPEFREAVAVALGKLFWGRRGKSTAYTETTRAFRPSFLRLMVEAEESRLKKTGERGWRTKALENVAQKYAGGIEAKSLSKFLRRRKR